ncbi:hypothetical protein ACTXT7_012092 [Hymenolepis weldensis]
MDNVGTDARRLMLLLAHPFMWKSTALANFSLKSELLILKKYFTFIGCTFAVHEIKPAEEEQTTEKKTETIAHLRAPLVFKPARALINLRASALDAVRFNRFIVDAEESCIIRYNFDKVAELSKVIQGQLLGAGAGPFFTHSKNCEMVANVNFLDSKVISNSTLHGVYNETTNKPEVIRSTDNNFALLAHLLSTEGLLGSIIEVDVSGRLKEGAAYVFLREALTAAYGKLAKSVALGGVFVLTDSNARFHVLVSQQLFIIALPIVYNLTYMTYKLQCERVIRKCDLIMSTLFGPNRCEVLTKQLVIIKVHFCPTDSCVLPLLSVWKIGKLGLKISEFPDHPVDTPERVAAFLKYFEMEPPVLGVGTLVSHDPYNADLKLEHFHCYNEAQTLAGHFYWDTEPEKAHYRFYLAVAKSLLRIDPKINP